MEEQLLAFLKYLEQEHHYSENTIAAYRNDLGQFLGFVEDSQGRKISSWEEVNSDYIQAYLDFMKNKPKPYASSTIARKVAAIKSFFNYLTGEHIISENPALDIDSPKVKKRLPQTLTLEEVDKLLAAPATGNTPKNLRDQALLSVLYSTGMRVSEVVSLKLDDVDFKNKVLHPPGKTDDLREIPLEKETAELLEKYLAEGRPQLVKNDQEQSLFLNHRGEKLTRQGLWLIIKGYAKQVDLESEVTPHTLRHSFAAHRLSKGSDLEEIQRLLGHANISTTQIYTQLESAEETTT
ncbi:MAG: tyrosine recombinase [Chloroflexota bacterium]